MKSIVGLIVNPVAGMGGSVGLKGTDGETYKKALELGAGPVTPKRTKDCLSRIERKDDITLFVAPGKMGEEYVGALGMPLTVIGAVGEETSAEDTRRIAVEMVNRGVELLIFVGGDGTARDIYDAIDSRVPVVAVPSGVKIFSSVFAVSARSAAEMVDSFVEGTDVTEEQVLDIDEEAFREDRLASRLYGYLLVPNMRSSLQPGKAASSVSVSSIESKKQIAAYVVEERERVWRTLNELAVHVYPSTTNFLLVKTESPDIVKRLGDIGILVLDLSNQLPSGFVRVSIGTGEENDAFIAGYLKIRETYLNGMQIN
jgi:predicted polyphosphate/ATP-dependent NAD kinase